MVEGAVPAPVQTWRRAKRLRREMSLPEVILWQHLRKERLAELHFRRQHPIGPYVLDFYCAKARLCVEVDGLAHFTEVALRDERRTRWLEQQGIRVLRLQARDVLRDELLAGALRTIEAAANSE